MWWPRRRRPGRRSELALGAARQAEALGGLLLPLLDQVPPLAVSASADFGKFRVFGSQRAAQAAVRGAVAARFTVDAITHTCLLYTSPSPRD